MQTWNYFALFKYLLHSFFRLQPNPSRQLFSGECMTPLSFCPFGRRLMACSTNWEATDLHMIMTGENTVAPPEPEPVSESRSNFTERRIRCRVCGAGWSVWSWQMLLLEYRLLPWNRVGSGVRKCHTPHTQPRTHDCFMHACAYCLGRALGSWRMVRAACTKAMGVATYPASALERQWKVKGWLCQ